MRSQVIILAAGKGKRMASETPKVLVPFRGKPLVSHLIESVIASGVDAKPLLVVGWGGEEVKRVLGSDYQYATQDVQLGTGHAVGCAETVLIGKPEEIIVLYGDQPFIRPETIQNLQALHRQEKKVLTMMTVEVEDFNSWRAPFLDFGRILRDKNGKIIGIIEKKDATEEQLAIREVNPSLFCFKADWLWDRLKKLNNHNVQQEYYLTDLVRVAIEEGEEIASMNIDALESVGINTPNDLQVASLIAKEAAF